MSSETTPLSYGSISSSEVVDRVKGIWKNVFSQDNMEAAQSKMTDLQESAMEGDFSIRLMALLGGVSLVISTFFGIFQLVLHFKFTMAILEFYTFLMGCVMLLLESFGHIRKQRERLSAQDRQQISTQIAFLENTFRNLFKYALFLKFVWGRGGLYVVAGSLQLAQGTVIDYFVGGFVMLVGIMYIVVGRRTADKMTLLRQSLAQSTLKSKFQEADRDGNGHLCMDDFKFLVESLGMQLSRHELEVAFMCMDKTETGRISFMAFQRWWSDWEDGRDFV